MKIGALIPARIGSKRLPKKNIKLLGDKPLICWTLDVLLEADIFDDITVSTESDEIADVVRQYYSAAEVNILNRPAELAGDNSNLVHTETHYLANRPHIEWFGLFMPTYPFRKVGQLRKIQAAILSGHPWRVQTASTDIIPISDYYYPCAEGVKRFFLEPCFYSRIGLCTYSLCRRDARPYLWNKYGLSQAERTYIVHADKNEAIDIDTIDDFKEAEKVALGYCRSYLPLEEFKIKNWIISAPKGINWDAFIQFIENKLENTSQPILILEDARPPLTFLYLGDGCQRRPWISPEASTYLHDPKIEKTGNMQYMPLHYLHNQYYRIKRDLGDRDNYRFLGKTDAWGGFHGLDGSAIPSTRIIFFNEIRKQDFYRPPFRWGKELGIL